MIKPMVDASVCVTSLYYQQDINEFEKKSKEGAKTKQTTSKNNFF